MNRPRCYKGRELCLLVTPHYHVHKYGRRRQRRVCARCGTRRRYDGANWQWREPGKIGWRNSNPACVPRGGCA